MSATGLTLHSRTYTEKDYITEMETEMEAEAEAEAERKKNRGETERVVQYLKQDTISYATWYCIRGTGCIGTSHFVPR